MQKIFKPVQVCFSMNILAKGLVIRILVALSASLFLNIPESMASESSRPGAMNVVSQDEVQKGWRAGVVMLPTKLSLVSGETIRSDQNIPTPMALSLGFEDLSSGRLGWATDFTLAYFEDQQAQRGRSLLRWGGQFAYQFNSKLFVKAGPTVTKLFGTSRYVKNLSDTVRSHGLGYQVAMGLKISSKVGLDLGFSETNMPDLQKGGSLRMSGPEVGLAIQL